LVLGKFANKDTAMINTAKITAARPYLKVHLLYIFLPLMGGEGSTELKSTFFKVH
jgi:hypothetical protein